MLRIVLALALLGGLLSGCGQSGPLYLPGDPSSVMNAPPPAPAEPEASEEPEDDAERPEG